MDRRILFLILIAVLLIWSTVSVNGGKKKKSKRKIKIGPRGIDNKESTTCDEFSKNARFNPYSVLNEKWFVFYYWGHDMPIQIVMFTYPTANISAYLHDFFDGNVTLPVNWSARHVIMSNQYNTASLLVERNDRGYYWRYNIAREIEREDLMEPTEVQVRANGGKFRTHKLKLIEPHDVRFKQTNDGRLLGWMDCRTHKAFVMSRVNEVPPKNRIQDEAAQIGFRGRKGKSYLYQGHEWGPVSETDENVYWARKPTVTPEDVEIKDPKIDKKNNDVGPIKEPTQLTTNNEPADVLPDEFYETDIKTDEYKVFNEQNDNRLNNEFTVPIYTLDLKQSSKVTTRPENINNTHVTKGKQELNLNDTINIKSNNTKETRDIKENGLANTTKGFKSSNKIENFQTMDEEDDIEFVTKATYQRQLPKLKEARNQVRLDSNNVSVQLESNNEVSKGIEISSKQEFIETKANKTNAIKHGENANDKESIDNLESDLSTPKKAVIPYSDVKN